MNSYGLEDRLYRAIVRDYEGRGEAWTTDDSGDALARAAAEVVMREVESLVRAAFGAGFDLATDEPLCSQRDFNAKCAEWWAGR